MGILSDPSLSSSGKKSKYMTLISKYLNSFCFLFYAAGLVWFAALSLSDLQSKTYFSENALLPGNNRSRCCSIITDIHSNKTVVIHLIINPLKVSFFRK